MRGCGPLPLPLPLLLPLLALLGRTPHGAKLKRPQPLPPFITPCPADEHLDECGAKNARTALPTILKGDPGFGLPPLDPMVVPRVQFKHGGGSQAIELDMHRMEITGMKDLSVNSWYSDLPKGLVGLVMHFPRLQVLTDYEVRGKLSALALQGRGRANITIVGADVNMTCVYHLVDHDHIKYMRIDDLVTTMDVSRVYFNMGRKFAGSPLLAEAVNLFLNENWQEVLKMMGPPMLKTVKVMTMEMSSVLVDTVPYNSIFPGAVPEEEAALHGGS